jgi:hypothetical protein
MKTEINASELELNGVKYVRKDSIQQNNPAPDLNGMKMVMIRTYSAGVHFGYLKSRTGKEVELLKARRVWYWSGACSISQLAMEGSTKISECKISMEVESIELLEAIEIIPMTDKAITNLNSAKVWKQ